MRDPLYSVTRDLFCTQVTKKSIATSFPITMSKVIEKAYSLLRLSSLKQR